MVDYVVTYDVAALIIILMFSAYYFTRKRYKNVQNKMFTYLVLLVIASITLDIVSVFILKDRANMPVWLLYASNMAYFIDTGAMSVMFCLYSLKQTRSDRLIRHSALKYLLYLTPYLLFLFSTLSTPFTGVVFYIDANHDYGHGPLMDTMLLIVVLYLAFSFICMTVSNDEVSLKKRFPYYLFMIFMVGAILVQWLSSVYLLYGFAEALGVVIVYLSNHNPTDMVDYSTELFNRRAFMNRVEEIGASGVEHIVFGMGIKDLFELFEEDDTENGEILLSKVGRFMRENFSEDDCFYLGGGTFALILHTAQAADGRYEEVIRTRFDHEWTVGDKTVSCEAGYCRLLFPTEVSRAGELIDRIQNCISLSYELLFKTVTFDDIGSLAEKKLRKLERKQKQLEEQYIETEDKMQKAVNADRSKSLFLAQMSHEIRTPMTAILGMTELLLRDSDNERVRQHASAIMSSGKSLIGIINDILDFSKIEAGKLELIDEEYYLSSTVNDVIGSIEQRVSDKRLDLSVDFDRSIPAVLWGDEIRVKQIIINLLTNACKYTEQGGISLKLTWEKKDDICELIIVVSDTGIGIKEEYIPKLFIGFERFDGVRNKAIEGTGLGLAICKQLLDTMHGSIDVKSTYGEGSEFTVRIPQRIIDPTPSVNISEPEALKVLALCSSGSELRDYRRVFDSLGVSCTYAMSSGEFDEKRSVDDYTHMFIPLSEFQQRINAHDALVSDPRVIVALYYRQYSANVSGHRTINMPIFSINVASILGGDTVMDSGPKATDVRNYTAPEASILVVDDNVVNLQIFTGLLECHHFRIDTADSGYKCLKMVRDKRYDIIFLDHMMPRKDGIETLHDMEADELSLNKGVPVVAFTANAVSGMKEKFAAEGFSDFLPKPIDISRMEDILISYLPPSKVIYFDPALDMGSEASLTAGSQPAELSFTVPGLDMEKALFYAGGSYKALRSILEVFLKDGHSKNGLQPELVENSRFDDYRVEIHAVKSLCKSLGADDLSERARLLEQACKDGDLEYVRKGYLPVYEDYQKLLDNIEATLDSIRTAEPQPVRSDSIMDEGEQLTCILALLKEFEEELASKLITDLDERDIDPAYKESVADIKELLDVFDFDGAISRIEEVLNDK